MVTVEIRHPDAASIFPAAQLLVDLESGHWGSAAHLCADMLTDADAAARDLDALAVRVVRVGAVDQFIEARVTDVGVVVFEAVRLEHAVRALDVFMRVLCGQWSELAFTGLPVDAARSPFDLHAPLHAVRARWTAPGRFPEHPHASWGIYAAPEPARVAYGAWKSLGEGVQSRPGMAVNGRAVETSIRGKNDASCAPV